MKYTARLILLQTNNIFILSLCTLCALRLRTKACPILELRNELLSYFCAKWYHFIEYDYRWFVKYKMNLAFGSYGRLLIGYHIAVFTDFVLVDILFYTSELNYDCFFTQRKQ